MPLPEASKRRVVISLGLNPDEYTLGDDDIARPIVKEQPTQGFVSATPSASKFSPTGTVVRNAALGVGPAAAGLATGTTVTEATAPFIGPWAIVPGLLAGIGSSMATAWGQNKVVGASGVGKQFLQDTAAANAENPKSAVVGNLAAQLPFMRPSMGMLKDARMAFNSGQGVAGSVGQVLASPAGQNIALGAGLGAGQGLYDEATSEQPVDYGRLALNVLGGAALHKPTGLASRALGVHPYVSPAELGRYTGQQVQPEYAPTPVQASPTISPADALIRQPIEQGDLNINSPARLVSSQAKTDKMARYESNDPILQRLEEERMAGEGNVIGEVNREVPENRYQHFQDLAAEKTREMQLDKIQQDFVQQQTESLKAKNDAKQAELDRYYKTNQQQQESKGYPNQLAEDIKSTLEAGQIPTDETRKVNPQKTNTKNIERANTEVAAESPADLAMRQAEGLDDRYAVKGQQSSPEQKPKPELVGVKGLREANIAAGARHTGVDFAYEPGKTIQTPGGKEVYGYSQGTKVRAAETKPDTVTHEFSHVFMDEITPKQKEMFQKVMSNDPVVQRWIANEKANGRNPGNGAVTPEFEYLAQRAGDTDINRIINRDSNLAKDTAAWYRSNFGGKSATTDDFARWLGNRFAVARTSRASGVVDSGKVVARTSGVGQPDTSGKEEPTKLFHDNQKLLGEAIKSRNEEDIRKYWKIQEDIKNTHFKGHSPEGYALKKAKGEIKEQDVTQKSTTNKELLDATLPENFKENLDTEKSLDNKMLKPGSYRQHDAEIHDNVSSANKTAKDKYWAMKEQLGGDPARNQDSKQESTDNHKDLPAEDPRYWEGELKARQAEYDKLIANPSRDNVTFGRTNDQKAKLNGLRATIKHIEASRDYYIKRAKDIAEGNYRPQDKDQSPTTIEVDPSRRGFLRSLTGQYDQVAEVSKPLSEGLKNYESGRDPYIGASQVAVKELNKYPQENLVKVEDLMDEAFRSKTQLDEFALKAIPDGEAIRDALSEFYHDNIGQTRRKLGMRINGREAGLNENYIPHQLSDNSLDLFTRRGNSPEAKAAKREWAKYVVEASDGKISFDTALENIVDYTDALGGDRNNYTALKFGAIRKAEGFGIPKSLRETNPTRNLEKYARRAASDLSFYEHIESKPELMAALKLPMANTVGEHKAGQIPKIEGVEHLNADKRVRDAMKIVLGNLGATSGINPKINAAVRMVNAGILGPATGVRDVVSIPVNTLPYIQRLSDFGAALRGISQFRQESHNALSTAAKKPNLDKLVMGDILEAPDRVSKALNSGATLLRKWQGREAIENFGRDITFSIGKELARNNLLAAKSGDAKGKKFLEKFGRLVKGDVTEHTGEQLEASLNQIAKNLTDRIQGSYGGTGLPASVMEGNLAPFLALQKWGIEKSNIIYQDIVKPFLSGENRLPLLSYALGSVLTGATIQELNKLLSNREPQEADYHEALANGSAKNIAAELATIMQLGNFAGIVSDSVKVLSDVSLSGKTPRNIVSFPAATAAADLQEKLADYSEALQQGSDPWSATKMFALDMFSHNVQLARLVANHTLNREDVDRSDRFRDLRVYRELEGAPVGEPTKSNKYLDSTVGKYKKTGDVQEAADMLPNILDKFQTLVAKQPEKAMRYLRSVRSNNYQTMPAPSGETMQEFADYYSFVSKVKGDKAAEELLNDYIHQGSVNRVKSEMVPSF